VSTTGEGRVSVSPQSPYFAGSTISLYAVPAAGWLFAGWSGDLTGTANPVDLYLNGDISVTAAFVQRQYTLTANTAGSGTVSVSGSGVYHYGDKVVLTASPGDEYQFEKWTGDISSSDNPAEIIMNGDKIVTAHFKLLKTKTPEPSLPSGTTDIGNQSGNSENVPHTGTPEPVTPTPAQQTSDIGDNVADSPYNWWWSVGLFLAAGALGVILSC
jgi:hypothetical protein